jgi:hypothetical protein
MLSTPLLELLRLWWRTGRERGVMLPVSPLTTRQSRQCHAANAPRRCPTTLHKERYQGIRSTNS